MRKATTVKPIMWRKPNFKRRPPHTKLVFLLLIHGPQANLCPIQPYSLVEIMDYTGLTEKKIREALNELIGDNRIIWDEDYGLILVLRWIKHNPLRSIQQERGAVHAAAAYQNHYFHEIATYLIHGGDPDRVYDTLPNGVSHTPQGQGQGNLTQKEEEKKILELKCRDYRADAVLVLEHLRQVTGRDFKMADNIETCMKRDGATVEDCKLVIDFKWQEWAMDPRLSKMVDNTTPWRPTHFKAYLDQARAGEGESNAPLQY